MVNPRTDQAVGAAGHCAGCGAPLASPDAVCPACDAALTPAPPDTTQGRYRCPACSTHFRAPTPTRWPAQVPWYLPQGMRPMCPHCRSVLRDRWFPPTPGWLGAVQMVVLVWGAVWGFPRNVAIFLLCAVVLAQVLLVLRHGLPRRVDRYGLEPGGASPNHPTHP